MWPYSHYEDFVKAPLSALGPDEGYYGVMNVLALVVSLPMVVGGIILLLICWALIKRGMKLVGTLITIAILLAVGWFVLGLMGVLPLPSIPS
jgi:hypothetical protein